MTIKLRWPIVLLLCGTLVLATLAAGCDTATAEAREFMERGDAILTGLGPVIDTMYEALWALRGEIIEGRITSSSQYESASVFVRADNDEYKRQLDDAKGEFEKILELNGVDDYAEYAQLRLDAIENAYGFSNVVSTTLDGIGNVVSRIEAGELAGSEAIAAALEPLLLGLVEKDKEVSARATELREKAEALKKDKEL
ncbi:MAG: hypothetical protein KKB90_04100 [Actinobacteria bacterium]|nr:hypothetical protein [Actinomycetota bacterium]MCG2818682.1 hypothetical protein [Actinomycetes bacterium]MBU4178844.1 hypothetical protein [Actinomycetota bacterium]MBU4218128.1 hypothetical protein [Actinomycetota bacterium]MBU4358553.1 hypothetical protein [Actinomycetota bacterium]